MALSRHNNTSGVQCATCNWEGQICDCRHGYEPDPHEEDVHPQDYCPVCGSDQLEPIDDSD